VEALAVSHGLQEKFVQKFVQCLLGRDLLLLTILLSEVLHHHERAERDTQVRVIRDLDEARANDSVATVDDFVDVESAKI